MEITKNPMISSHEDPLGTNRHILVSYQRVSQNTMLFHMTGNKNEFNSIFTTKK